MINTGKFAALAITTLLAFNPAFAEDKSAAMVNSVSIPQSRIDLLVKGAAAQGQPDSPELRKMVRDEIINRELLAQEAVKMGLDKNPDVVQQMELAMQSVLVNVFAQDYLKNHPVSDDQIKQEYDKYISKSGTQEYNARHILVDTEDEAKSLIAQLGKKGKFEVLAKAKSKDTGSAERGGSLGWTVPNSFVPPFANAMMKLKKGEYTREPVQSQFGWHVIKLDDVRSAKAASLDELKPQLQQRLQQQTIQNEIADLRSKAKIE